jgi:NADPH:quinone reductase
MKAVTLKAFGGPEVLQVGEVPTPKPGPEQVLVRVRVTALNRADTLQRKGAYPPPPGESEIIGLELAGEVDSWGSSVTGFKKGDRVMALVGGGGYAEYCLVDKDMAMRIPDGWSFAQAAAVPEVYFTANETVFVLGNLQPGETLLCHAGGSGVGTAAIQMAHHIGAKVYFTAGSQDKIDRAMALGADAGINYKTQDFAEEIKRLTNGEGVDVVEDFLGASYFARNIASLKTNGRLVLVAMMGGSKTEVDLAQIQRKRLAVFGTTIRARPLAEKRRVTKRFLDRWMQPLAQGKLKAIIDSTYPMEKAADAHRRMDSNENFGKILLEIP